MEETIEKAVAKVAHLAPHLHDDLVSEATLAYLEYDGPDPLRAMVRRLRKFLAANREIQGVGPRGGRFRVVGKPVPLSPPKRLTASKQTKLRRNLVIQAARKQGCSVGLLAEVFDLPKSLIAKVIKKNLARELH